MKNIAFRFALMAITICCSTIGHAQYGTITTVAGGASSFTFGGDGDLATAASVGMFFPSSVSLDPAGDIFIYDSYNARIRKVNHSTGIITTIAGNGTGGYTGDGGPAPLAEIEEYEQDNLTTDNIGNCYITSSSHNRIRKIDYATGVISTIGGNGSYSNSGDGGPATAAGISSPRSIYSDASGNIFILTGAKIRVITVATGIISTYAGSTSSGFSGDGGPATAALFGSLSAICGDAAGNIYVMDNGNHRVRKIDASGIVTTIAGSGINVYSGNGGTASAAGITSSACIGVDNAGNVYFYEHSSIRRITAATGKIDKIAGSSSGSSIAYSIPGVNAITTSIDAQGIYVDASGNIFYADGNSYIQEITGAATPINTFSLSDSTSIACTLPRTVAFGMTGTVIGTPASTDSVHITVDYGEYATNSTRSYVIPYWHTTTYGFGSIYSSLPAYTYHIPGTYTPSVSYTAIGGYSDVITADSAFIVGSNCSTGITGISVGSTIDTFTSLPCTLPMNVRFKVSGTVSGTPVAGDSVYLVYQYDMSDTADLVHIVPIVHVGTVYSFSDVVNHPYTAGSYNPQVLAVTSSGRHNATGYPDGFTVNNCSGGSVQASINDTAYSSPYCSLPFSNVYTVYGTLSDYADTCSRVRVYVNYGDGTDTSFVSQVYTDGLGSFYYGSATPASSFSLRHTYSIPGTFGITIFDTTGAYTYNGTSSSSPVTLATSCSPLTGTFYIDANGDCIYQNTEVPLGYWPYAIINNTLGDTTYGWCDDSGRYALQVIDGDSYTVVANPFTYFSSYGFSGDSLHIACPASGIYTFTAVAGASFIQDFGFNCTPVADIDMSVSGWMWGAVPGDTGIVAIWSSDYTGYICTPLTSTVTLTLDPLLTYIGMWDGPAPTTVSGSTLTWNFTTTGDLFDFTAHVKVVTATTATMGANVCNNLYVTPTSLPDPYMANNTYSWCEPVTSSWDPNEKQVSPQGSGPQGFIPNGTPLSYMIHFQNTGTARARNITVSDTISNNLDLSTLQVVSSSSSVLVYQEPGNVVKFRFNDINLPDSVSDPMGSIGYIAFNIVPRAALAPGTQITNLAGIYFDYNPAVLTNTTLNTINNVGLITGPAHICVGASATLSDTTSGGTWSTSNPAVAVVSGGVVTGTGVGTVVITYTVPGGYTTQTINTVTAPVVANTSGLDIVCAGASIVLANTTSGGTWSSANGSATVSGGVVTGIVPGTDTIIYTVSNACGTVQNNHVVNVITGGGCLTNVQQTTNMPRVIIYPNPATDELVIKTEADAYSTLSVTNTIGQVLMRQDIKTQQTTLNVKALAPGIYNISLRGKNGVNVQKFVKVYGD